MGPNSNTKTPETHNLDAQMSSNCLEKKRRCYTMVNIVPVPTILRPVAGIKLKWANFVHKIVKFLSLNICYVIYVLLWIKYWLMWFEIFLVLILFKFKKRHNISGIWVVIINFYSILFDIGFQFFFSRFFLKPCQTTCGDVLFNNFF